MIAEVRSLGGDGVAVIGDAREEDTAIRAVEAAKKLGGVHILINNVGVGNYKNLVDTSLADYVEMMDSNVRTSFLFTRHAVPTMIAQRDGLDPDDFLNGRCLWFSGRSCLLRHQVCASRPCPGARQGIAQHGIKVGTINPGGVKTEFALGKGRTRISVAKSDMLEAEDVAAAVHFACIQPKGSRIIQIQMRTMAEALA